MRSPNGSGFRRGGTSPVAELLIAATAAACRPGPHPRIAELAATAGDAMGRDLPALAGGHRVEGCVHAVLEQVEGVDPDVLDRLAVGRRQAAQHHLLVRDVLARVGAVLDAAGIPWLAFKGPVLSSAVYCDPGMRRYSDLDLMVPPDRFADAVAALEDADYENPVTSWEPQVYLRSGAIAFKVGRISVDLHWHVAYKYQDRRWYSIDTDQLLARRRSIDIAGHTYATFDEVDTVFHLALHAAREGCHRLVWLKDIQLAIAVGQPDLDELVRRAVGARCAPAVGIALARSKWTLGTAVPDDIIAALVGRIWPRVVKAVVAFDDLGSTRGRPSPGTVLTRETRMSIPHTAERAVRRISERRVEKGFERMLRRGFDLAVCSPDERARNELDRAEFFALVREWRSELP